MSDIEVAWSSEYHRYYRQRYNHNTSQWDFLDWDASNGTDRPYSSPFTKRTEPPVLNGSDLRRYPARSSTPNSSKTASPNQSSLCQSSSFHPSSYSPDQLHYSELANSSKTASPNQSSLCQSSSFHPSSYSPDQLHYSELANSSKTASPNQSSMYQSFSVHPSSYSPDQLHYSELANSSKTASPNQSSLYQSSSFHPSSYSPGQLHYFELDSSYRVRPRNFFTEGRVFAVMFSETAASSTKPINYNNSSSLSEVRHAGNIVYTAVRQFVVVRQKREFCYACPIFTYSGRATTKPGVRESEHAIVYSSQCLPRLLPGEAGITKSPICVIMAEGVPLLSAASRIYFGIHHPIQYNVKVKDIGVVAPNDFPILTRYWREEGEVGYSSQASEVTDEAANETKVQLANTEVYSHSLNTDTVPAKSEVDLEVVTNPKAFFKKGRVFMTRWSEPRGVSAVGSGTSGATEAFAELARFAVVKPKSTHCICIRISTYSGQATTKPGISVSEHAAVLPVGGLFQSHPKGEPQLTKDPIFVKVENPTVTIDPMSRINFGKPYTVEYNIVVRNIGRVFGDSVAKMDEYFAESLGLTR
ncbi:hypothetical protein E8E13_003070 [Curvularia kusanoi]|uniref:DUF6590 domain-containing protein n=1 Tax=Curvularia kusanoi TaxID=90978 RepID=A0A9P4WBT5_CURKU|nr:hypothetical protein E8E13_003070 [Curvularia kusanoi]